MYKHRNDQPPERGWPPFLVLNHMFSIFHARALWKKKTAFAVVLFILKDHHFLLLFLALHDTRLVSQHLQPLEVLHTLPVQVFPPRQVF